jgi:hypothetical protein
MIVVEDHTPVVAPASDMIKSIGIQNSQWTRHNPHNNGTKHMLNYISQDLTFPARSSAWD